MARLHLLAVFLGVFLLSSCYSESAEDVETKSEDVAVENVGVVDNSDLETAETKDLFDALKQKVDSLFQPLKSIKRGLFPSYRQYYSSSPSYGYYKQTPNYMQQIQDCYGYGSSSGYGGSATPSKSYYIGGRPVYSSGNSGYPGGQGTSFDGSFSGSASIGGGSSYSSNYNSGGYFKPSKPTYYSYTTYDSPSQSFSNSGSGQGYYYTQSYPGYNSPKTTYNPTPSYYYYTAPQVQQPQYVQSTVPIQPQPYHPPVSSVQVQPQPFYPSVSSVPVQPQPYHPPISSVQVQPQPFYPSVSSVPVQPQPFHPSVPATYNSQSYIHVSTPNSNNVDTSTQTPPSSFSIAFVVPPGQSSQREVQQDINYGVNPSTPSPLPSSSPSPADSVPITPRPQYNIQNTPLPITSSNRPSVLSIYSTDSYLSRPYIYSPAYSYGYDYSLGGGSVSNPPKYNTPNSQSHGFYYVPSSGYASSFNGIGDGYQFQTPGVYPGSSSGVSQGGGMVFPTDAPVTPHVHC